MFFFSSSSYSTNKKKKLKKKKKRRNYSTQTHTPNKKQHIGILFIIIIIIKKKLKFISNLINNNLSWNESDMFYLLFVLIVINFGYDRIFYYISLPVPYRNNKLWKLIYTIYIYINPIKF